MGEGEGRCKNIFIDNGTFSLTIRLGEYCIHVDFSCSFLKQRQCYNLGVHSMSDQQVFANYFNAHHILYLFFSFHSSNMDCDLVISIYYTETYIHWIILYTQAPFPTFLFQLTGPMLNNKEASDLVSPCLNVFMILPMSRLSWGKIEFQPKKALGKMFYVINMKVSCAEMKGKLKKN